MLIREPRLADQSAMRKLLEQVEFTSPGHPEEIARLAAENYQLDGVCGVRGAWVAEPRRGDVVAVVAAAPPQGWVGSMTHMSPELRSWVAHQVVDMEALSVAPEASGRRLGHRMIETAGAYYSGLGYRLMMGTFTTSSPYLADYYGQAGFTVLEPGESIVIYDPLGAALHRPSEPHVVQMWKPLHPDVAVVDTHLPDGTPLKLLTEVLVPPADAPKAVLNDDGTLTLEDGEATHTYDANTTDKIRQMFQTQVTAEEVAAGAEEAMRYGIEPIVAARLRKASGYTLRELVGDRLR